MRLAIITCAAACILTLPGLAAAEPAHAIAERSAYELGVRIGGYGFRREHDGAWDECRMNGFGVFAGRTVRGPVYVEAGLDLYTSVALDPTSMDLPIDRTSGLFGVAAGARTQVTSWLRGYIQVGGGVELARVAVPYGDRDTIRDTRALPQGFFGAGLDVRIARKTYVGTTFRALAMGNFNYARADLDQRDHWGFIAPDADEVFDASIDVAAQAQFYVRRDM